MAMLSMGSAVEVAADAVLHEQHPLDAASGSMLAFLLECAEGHHERPEALARIRGARRLKAFAEALEQAALLDVAGLDERAEVHELGGRLVAVHDEAVAEVALATAQSEAAVRRRLATARTLEASLPATRQALADGRIDAAKAAMLAHAATRVPEASRGLLEQSLLEPARTLHARDFKVAAEQAVRCVDPDGDEARRARAVRRRAVWLRPDEDGNAILAARLASAEAHLALRSLQDHVRSCKDEVDAAHDLAKAERPTVGMLQAEEMVRRLMGSAQSIRDDVMALQSPSPLGAVPTRMEVHVRVDLATLAALQDDPVVIDGLTVTDATQLRQWLDACEDVRFRRLICDPETDSALDLSTTAYSAGRALRRFIVARDGRCIWSGCTAMAIDCDMDHAVPYGSGGQTRAENLNALCRSHHVLKTLYGYRLVQGDGGTWMLVTPTGEILPTGNHPPDV